MVPTARPSGPAPGGGLLHFPGDPRVEQSGEVSGALTLPDRADLAVHGLAVGGPVDGPEHAHRRGLGRAGRPGGTGGRPGRGVGRGSSWTRMGPRHVGHVHDAGLARSSASPRPSRRPCRTAPAGRGRGGSASRPRYLGQDRLEGAVVEDVAVLVDLDEGGALVARGPGGRSPSCACGPCRGCGPRTWPRRPGPGDSGLNGLVDRAERRRLGDLAHLAGRRVLPLGQPVDLVVEQQDGEVHVAAQGVDQVVATDREPVAVAGDHPHVEVGPGHGEAGGHGGRPAVDGVHPVGVHVVREPARAADAGDEHGVLRRRCPGRA